MPDHLSYDETTQTLHVGEGQIHPVQPEVYAYSVGGKRILTQWFSSRRADRERPVMGDRRTSPLSTLQPQQWLPEYTSDLIDLLHVLTLLSDVHPPQVELLGQIADGPLVSVEDLTVIGVLPIKPATRTAARRPTTAPVIPADPDTLFG